MRNELNPLRPCMTALCAIVAMSSTPAFAQTADTASSAPVLVLPPPPAQSTAGPAVAAPAAPTMTVAPVVTAAPPVADSVSDAATASAVKQTHRTVAKTTIAKTGRTAAADHAKATPAPEPAAPVTAPIAAAMPEPQSPAPIAKSTPAAPVVHTATTTTVHNDDLVPIAGAGGLAVLALAGGAFALGRRRRRGQADGIVAPVETEATPLTYAPAPVAAVPATATAKPVSRADADALPDGFDLSRFGPHVQAAYVGPTPENPSHSLRRRLKRARYFDQRDRAAAEHGAVRTTERKRDRMFDWSSLAPKPAFRPAFQS